LKRKISKWHWLLWSILPLVVLLAEAVAAADGASATWLKYATPQKATNAFSFSQGASDRSETAIVRVYPPPQSNNNLLHPGSDYFPGAAAIFTKRTALSGQGYGFIALVIGLFAHFYGSARNSAGLDDDPVLGMRLCLGF
jgi:hypothetical protein